MLLLIFPLHHRNHRVPFSRLLRVQHVRIVLRRLRRRFVHCRGGHLNQALMVITHHAQELVVAILGLHRCHPAGRTGCGSILNRFSWFLFVRRGTRNEKRRQPQQSNPRLCHLACHFCNPCFMLLKTCSMLAGHVPELGRRGTKQEGRPVGRPLPSLQAGGPAAGFRAGARLR